jgi:hypothetical protein
MATTAAVAVPSWLTVGTDVEWDVNGGMVARAKVTGVGEFRIHYRTPGGRDGMWESTEWTTLGQAVAHLRQSHRAEGFDIPGAASQGDEDGFDMPGAISEGDPLPGQCTGRVHREGDPTRNCVRRTHAMNEGCWDVEGYTEQN